jgi:hypothetical protein
MYVPKNPPRFGRKLAELLEEEQLTPLESTKVQMAVLLAFDAINRARDESVQGVDDGT